ncbi:hypothetical protein F5Y14DRAFT_180951 [Nemania sp. NC0429]|nr:hypothetical protein F5Y14DRAFT_180951 [Nemania sp. NC0429]
MASYSTDPALYIYTSLTAGSSHIVTATSRLETILRANRVPFKALDIATDEKARMIWGRRAGKDESGRLRKLPGLVQMGLVLGDLQEIEEWNEYGELKQHVTIYYDDFTIPPKSQAPPPMAMKPLNQPFPKSGVAPPASTSATTKTKAKIPLSTPTATAKKATTTTPSTPKTAATAISSIAEEAAQKAKKAQLDRLREKVHGKKEETKGKENEKPAPAPAAAKQTTPEKKTTSAVDSASKGMSKLAIGSGGLVGLRASPLGKVKLDASRGPDGAVTEHRGSVVVNASPEEIAAAEKAAAIPEVDSRGG